MKNENQARIETPKTFIMVSTKLGEEANTFYKLVSIEGITKINPIMGRYSLLAEIITKDLEGLEKISEYVIPIAKQIRNLENVEHVEIMYGGYPV